MQNIIGLELFMIATKNGDANTGDYKDHMIYKLMDAFEQGGMSFFSKTINSKFGVLGPIGILGPSVLPGQKKPERVILLELQRDIFQLEFPVLLPIFRNTGFWEDVVKEIKNILKISHIDSEELKILHHFFEIYRYVRSRIPKAEMLADMLKTGETSGLGYNIGGFISVKIKVDFPLLHILFKQGKDWNVSINELKNIALNLCNDTQDVNIITSFYIIPELQLNGIPLSIILQSKVKSGDNKPPENQKEFLKQEVLPTRSAQVIFTGFLEKIRIGRSASELSLILNKSTTELLQINLLHPAIEDMVQEAEQLNLRGARPLTSKELSALQEKVKIWKGLGLSEKKLEQEESTVPSEVDASSVCSDINIPIKSDLSKKNQPPGDSKKSIAVLFTEIYAKSQAGMSCLELSALLARLCQDLVRKNPSNPQILDITLELGHLKSLGTRPLSSGEIQQFIKKLQIWKDGTAPS